MDNNVDGASGNDDDDGGGATVIGATGDRKARRATTLTMMAMERRATTLKMMAMVHWVMMTMMTMVHLEAMMATMATAPRAMTTMVMAGDNLDDERRRNGRWDGSANGSTSAMDGGRSIMLKSCHCLSSSSVLCVEQNISVSACVSKILTDIFFLRDRHTTFYVYYDE